MTRTTPALAVLAVAMVAVSGAVPTTVTHTSTTPGPCVERQVRAEASMSLLIPTKDEPAQGCLRAGGVVDVSLPGDGAPVTVAAWLPPVCGPVRVTSWSFGGAPY